MTNRRRRRQPGSKAATDALPPPPSPDHRSALARLADERWQQVHPRLAARGDVDEAQLRVYCQTWARWRQAEDTIASAGQVVRSASGRPMVSPLVAIANQAARAVQQLEARLGLAAVEAAAADEPRADAGAGALLSRRELATRMRVHMMTVTKWERDGLPIAHRGRRGKASYYRESEVRAWLAAREAKANGSHHDVAQQRARKELAQAIEAEQRVAVRAGALVAREEVERAWAAEVAAVRTILLAWPSTLADRLHTVALTEGPVGIETTLVEAVHDLLRELADPNRAVVS